MARLRLSEFRAKSILYAALGQTYTGITVDTATKNWKSQLPATGNGRYVLKVDQAVKGRFKKGLVKLDRTTKQLPADASELSDHGYHFLLLEPFQPHETSNEQYVSFQRTKRGIVVTTAAHGGIDVEAHADELQSSLYVPGKSIAGLELSDTDLAAIIRVFDENYFSFLEINPLVIADGVAQLLDAAVEVDGEAPTPEINWSEDDLRRSSNRQLTDQEVAVNELSEQSQASFTLEAMNLDGSIFLLLSGGGASLIVADEVYSLGQGKQLANYGEYSGNPNADETEIYTTQVLGLLLASKAKRKALIIAGGVANFTDIRTTFTGVLRALKKHETALQQQKVLIYVRRGGPHEVEGLALIRDYLESAGLLGHVSGPELPLTEVARQAVRYIGGTK